MSEFDRLDATALAELVRTKKASARELVEHSIARIEKLNPTLNAVVTPMFESALARADAPVGDGPFAGVPRRPRSAPPAGMHSPCATINNSPGSAQGKQLNPGHQLTS